MVLLQLSLHSVEVVGVEDLDGEVFVYLREVRLVLGDGVLQLLDLGFEISRLLLQNLVAVTQLAEFREDILHLLVLRLALHHLLKKGLVPGLDLTQLQGELPRLSLQAQDHLVLGLHL